MSLMYMKPKGEIMRESVPAIERMTKKVEYPKEGGVLTYFWNERYPEKQLVYPEMFAILNPLKKLIPSSIELLKNSHLLKFLVILSFLPGGKKLRRGIRKAYAHVFWSGLRFVAFKPEHYCVSGRELRRALIEAFNPKDVFDEQLIDIVCLFWEYDNYYRTVGQDIFGILDRVKFLLDPVKETRRVLEEVIRRTPNPDNKRKFGMYLFASYLMYLPKIRKPACKFVNKIDFEKMKLDAGDFYWAANRIDYDVGGLPLKERMLKRNLMKLG